MTRQNQDGFTIVEMLVSILVAAILVGSLSIIVNNNSIIAQRGRDITIANSFAEGKFEELRSKGFLGLTDGTTTITPELPSELASPRSATLQTSDQQVGLKQVVLTITYNDHGKTTTFSYKSFIGELGVGQF